MNLNKKTFFLITGASRGIGKTMAIECSKKLTADSVCVLLARSEPGLKQTKEEILKNNSSLQVFCYSVDLSTAKLADFTHLLSDSLAQSKPSDYERALIIHNAGTLGIVSEPSKSHMDVEQWDKYFHENVSSTIVLNNEFMKVFAAQPKLIVNITSKAAIEPFPSMGQYCLGKAAREMYFRILAAEDQQLRVLNYSPGPVETDMTVDIQKSSHDTGIQNMFKGLRAEKTILTTEQTTKKFLEVIEANVYKSGDHVDYYD